jgi:hypothetical protein
MFWVLVTAFLALCFVYFTGVRLPVSERTVAAPAKAGTATLAEAQTAAIPGLTASDDFGVRRVAFEKAARELIESGKCSAADFRLSGGFGRSISRGRSYFIYCGGMSIGNRIYVRVDGDGYTIGR